MANTVKQNFSGSADEVNIRNNFPNIKADLEVPYGANINILLSCDRFQRLIQNLQQMANNNEYRQQGYEIVYQEPSANRGYSQN